MLCSCTSGEGGREGLQAFGSASFAVPQPVLICSCPSQSWKVCLQPRAVLALSAPSLPADPGSSAHSSQHLLCGSRHTGSGQEGPEGSFKKKRRKRKHRSTDRSPCAEAGKDGGEVSSPPKKERIVSPEGCKDKESRLPRKEGIASQNCIEKDSRPPKKKIVSPGDLVSVVGKEGAHKGVSHGLACQDTKSGPKQHEPEPSVGLGMEPASPFKRKKKKKKNRSKDSPLKKTEECSSGVLSSDR